MGLFPLSFGAFGLGLGVLSVCASLRGTGLFFLVISLCFLVYIPPASGDRMNITYLDIRTQLD